MKFIDYRIRTVTWHKLGTPQKPGHVVVRGLGIVKIQQRDIDDASAAGGDPTFELVDTHGMGQEPRYLLGLIR